MDNKGAFKVFPRLHVSGCCSHVRFLSIASPLFKSKTDGHGQIGPRPDKQAKLNEIGGVNAQHLATPNQVNAVSML